MYAKYLFFYIYKYKFYKLLTSFNLDIKLIKYLNI